VQVLCHADGRVRLQRFIERQRHAGHADGEVTMDLAEAWAAEWLAPLDLGGPVIEVDTTDLGRVDYEAVLRQVNEHVW
jgi:hypothetical protein